MLILGSLFFILYINNIILCSKYLHFILFAVNTNLLCSDRNSDCLIQKAIRALEDLSTWLKANGLPVNTKKTNLLMFSNRNHERKKFEIYFDSKVLNQEKSTKFVGKVVDDKLNLKKHTDSVFRKLSRNIGINY